MITNLMLGLCGLGVKRYYFASALICLLSPSLGSGSRSAVQLCRSILPGLDAVAEFSIDDTGQFARTAVHFRCIHLGVFEKRPVCQNRSQNMEAGAPCDC
jgi:hypothetical protein